MQLLENMHRIMMLQAVQQTICSIRLNTDSSSSRNITHRGEKVVINSLFHQYICPGLPCLRLLHDVPQIALLAIGSCSLRMSCPGSKHNSGGSFSLVFFHFFIQRKSALQISGLIISEVCLSVLPQTMPSRGECWEGSLDELGRQGGEVALCRWRLGCQNHMESIYIICIEDIWYMYMEKVTDLFHCEVGSLESSKD